MKREDVLSEALFITYTEVEWIRHVAEPLSLVDVRMILYHYKMNQSYLSLNFYVELFFSNKNGYFSINEVDVAESSEPPTPGCRPS